MEIENGRSVEAKSKMNGLLEENDEDCDIIQHPVMAQSGDSASRDRVEADNSTMMDLSASQDNSNNLSAEDVTTASMEMDANKQGERNDSEQHIAGGGRGGEELDRSELSSKRPRRRASSTAKPKATSQVEHLYRQFIIIVGWDCVVTVNVV